jgi:hypothetical protein
MKDLRMTGERSRSATVSYAPSEHCVAVYNLIELQAKFQGLALKFGTRSTLT